LCNELKYFYHFKKMERPILAAQVLRIIVHASFNEVTFNDASLSQSGYMRLQDFGSFERVHEDPKHVDTHGKTHHDIHDDIHGDDE
jgi:hypothetical protein